MLRGDNAKIIFGFVEIIIEVDVMYRKTISLFLCLAFVGLAFDVVPSVSADDAGSITAVYLSSSGNDSNSGIEVDKPLKTLKAALNKVNELELKGDSRVINITKCDWNGLSFDMSDCTPYTEMITLKSKTGLTVWSTTDIYLGGPLTLEADYGNSNSQQAMNIYTCGYDFNLSAKDKKGNSNIYAGYNTRLELKPDGTGNNIEWNKDINLRITGEREMTLGKVLIGNSNYISNNVFYGNANILIDNPNLTISTFMLGNNGNFANTGTQSNRFSEINITVNNVREIASLEGATYYNAVYTKDLQIIFNNGTADKITDNLIYGNYGNTNIQACKKWIIKNGTSGEDTYLNTTVVPGTFTVTGGNVVILTNDDDALSYMSENGNIRVPAGNYYMTVIGKEDYTFTDDTFIAIADLSGFNVTEIAPVQSNGRILLGFKDESGEYLSDTTDLNLAAGEKLYAVYTDFAVGGNGAAFRVSGAEKRNGKKTAIRFIIEKGADFETALKPLADVKYGYIVLPRHFIDLGETLTIDNKNAAMKSADDAGFVYYDGTEKFTVCITDIPERHHGESFAARGFVTYTDLNGNSRVVYTDTAYSSLFEVTANYAMNGDISEEEKAENTSFVNNVLSSKKTSLAGAVSNSPDTVTSAATGNTYYISENGSDLNSGLSKDKPIKTLVKLSYLSLKPGDAVLFERGGTYRTATKYGDGTSFRLKEGVSYGAYGTGAKPIINGSFENYAERKWSRYSGNGNIWYTDISNVSADPGVLRVTLNDGRQYTGCVKESISDLNGEWQFCQDGTVFYMYCQYGVPTNLLSNIEIGYGFDMFKIDNVGNIMVENLAFTCGGRHAIGGTAGANNVTVRGCEFSYIGGSIMPDSDGTRLGNAVEFLGDSTDILVEKCKFSNIYDSGVTFQGVSAKVNGFTVRNNIFEKCGLASFEYWLGRDGSAENIVVENNYMSDAGGGYGGIGKRTIAAVNVAHIRADGVNCISNFTIKNNIFDSVATGACLTALCCYKEYGGALPTLLHNVYITDSGSDLLNIRTGLADYSVSIKADTAGYVYLKQCFDGQPIIILR